MNLQSSNHYEVLGVEKTADERTVKKAYFALVRQYPPETHPEEFKKIREAYEVLSDAESRKEYDSISQYDEHGEQVAVPQSWRTRHRPTSLPTLRGLPAVGLLLPATRFPAIPSGPTVR